MNVKRYLQASAVLFVFITLYEWFVHGFILKCTYRHTADVWRPMDEMMANMPLTILVQLILAFWVGFIFTRFFPRGGRDNGVHFGFYIGVLVGILAGAWYFWLPVPVVLGLAWLVSGIVEGVLGGLILGSLYRNTKK